MTEDELNKILNLADRLKSHVEKRGGYTFENGAWHMMVEASEALYELVKKVKELDD